MDSTKPLRFKSVRNCLIIAMAVGMPVTAAHLPAQPPQIKPGPEHEFLKAAEGTWDAVSKSEGNEAKGVLTCRMSTGGLWLLENYKSEIGGTPFEGHGATSYDVNKKKYVNVWIDSMVTSPMLSEGMYDKATKTLTLVGNMPLPDGKTMKATMIFVYKNADTKTLSLRGSGPDGKDFEMVQITYKRRAK